MRDLYSITLKKENQRSQPQDKIVKEIKDQFKTTKQI